MRALDSPEAKPITGTEGAYCTPIFSPDGQSLAFFDVGVSELRRIALQGGPPVTLAKAGGIFGATWSNDSIIYHDVDGPDLKRISSTGGIPVSLTQVDSSKGETSHRWPSFLPGGKTFLFAIEKGTNPDDAQIVAQSLDTGQRSLLVEGGTYPQYVPAGYLVYVRGGKLMTVPFDTWRLQVTGEAVAAAEDIQESGSGGSQFGLSSQGSLVYIPPSRTERRLVWVSPDGTERSLAAPARNYDGVRLSPDGRRAAVELDSQIWLYDLVRDTLTRFTLEGDLNYDPVWSPDGKRIAFQSHKERKWGIFCGLVDGGGFEQLASSAYRPFPSSWSPDGQLLAFVDSSPLSRGDIWILRLSDHGVWPFLQTQFRQGAPAFSPDGNWLAYSSDESGRHEIYVQAYRRSGSRYPISKDGGTEPIWNPNGRELFYRNGNKVMAATVVTRPNFSAGQARMLFEGAYESTNREGESATYSVSPDGQRLLMPKSGEAAQISVVLNWFDELKHPVPSRT